jgi:probable selenium-dependent hydroxylase accessory protein YqeC
VSGATHTLSEALGLVNGEVVALVGSGGKTSALQLLACEQAQCGRRVVATTTTAMYLRELAAVGSVVTQKDDRRLADGLREALGVATAAAAASSLGIDGKVVGVAPVSVDALSAEGLADCLIVEADGSRGASLKAFGAHEPQVPASATTIVQVSGLDVLGKPLTEKYVHRSALLAAELGIVPGSLVSAATMASCLMRQCHRLRERWPAARVVVLLNKADTAAEEARALQVAGLLGRGCAESLAIAGRTREGPDAVVIASLQGRRFRLAPPAAATRIRRGGSRPGRRRAFVSAIVLAAGFASRMRTHKVLLPLGGRPMVCCAVDAALQSKAVETIVVLGHAAAPVARALASRPVNVVVNEDYLAGLSTSIHAGLRAVSSACEAALFLHADQPFVTPALLDGLIDQFLLTGKPIVRPLVGQRPANPVLMAAVLFPEIMEQHGDVGGREVVAKHRDEVAYVPVDDPGLLADIDVIEDYVAARRRA